MCGIVGVIGARPAAPLLLEALRRLEYRGYDSAGIATLVNGHIDAGAPRASSVNLAAALDRRAAAGHHRHRPYALGDARRADREQRPSARHRARFRGAQRHHREPRRTARGTGGGGPGIRHRDRHRNGGATGRSELTARHGAGRGGGRGVAPAGRRLCAGDDLRRPSGADVGAQHGAPLAVGFGDDEMFVGSDALALAPLTRRIAYLHDGDWTRGRSQGRPLLRHRRRPDRARDEADRG